MNRYQQPPRGSRGQRQERDPRSRHFDRHEEPENFQQFADDMFDEREADRYPHGYSAARSAPWAEPYRYGYPDAPRHARSYSGNREGPYGADVPHAENRHAGSRNWGREGAAYDRPQAWRGNAFDDGSYLGNAQRSPRHDDARNWSNEDAQRRAADGSTVSRLSGYGFYNSQAPEGRYGRQTPKGYTRSDDRIKDDVCGYLYHANDIDLSDVTIESKDGTLILEGTVPERRMKHRIEDIAEQCIGVRDVENRIRVSRDSVTQADSDRGNGAGRKPAATPGGARH